MDLKLQRYFLFPLLGLLAITLLTHCSQPVFDDQSGFVTIDCGFPETQPILAVYIFPVTYTSDEMFINTGVNARLLPKYISNNTEIYLETVRSFPRGKRNCYNLRSSKDKDSKFLVRAFFMYGNYMIIKLWDTIQLDNSSHVVTKEIIHVFSTNYTNVCLVNTGNGTPFISALECRTHFDYFVCLFFQILNPLLKILAPPGPFSETRKTLLLGWPSASAAETTKIDAIMDIKKTYDGKKNWQGDPCLPKDYTREGLRCNYSSSSSTRIIGLNLSSSELSGDIPSSLSNLTKLNWKQVLGSIPLGLAEKANNETLLLSMDGFVPLIKNHCQSAQCTKKKLSIPVVASVVVLLMLLIVVITICYFTKRKGIKRVDSFDSRSQRFSYTKIVSMTNNFEKILGRGGFGLVYHGYLERCLLRQDTRNFRLRVHHRNLISLVGYCYDGAYMALVYEYMANGTVKEHLNGPKSLTWVERLQVALNGAEGLDYLHNGCTPPIVHRDQHLLDDYFHAKLADFGISRAFSVDESFFVSTAVVGTIGYLDPEYAHLQKLHEKSDVYSFAVVLLELITGQPPMITSKNCHITQWVGNSLTTGDVADVTDPSLDGTYDSELVEKYVRLAISCCSPSSANRTTMHYVSSRLEEYLEAATEATKGIMVYLEDSSLTIPVLLDSKFSSKF
ncbi:hypothetical protein R3W88_008560 [Solanum pinnatisectum]|uniref:Protein kinase domain-containing protein n=1 Tax=Solanum pinnatisectum TaxID=50273 RepID=A0AAV9MBJ0_9SOLN|nr:hypothetical protein R3W88_008560 [Solanum pinnatisectum]